MTEVSVFYLKIKQFYFIEQVSKPFFEKALFRDIRKAMAPSNMIFKKLL